jgi:hypothetical protein
LAWCRDHLVHAPDDITTIVSIGHPPASIGLPDRLRDRAALHVIVCHSGPPDQARRDLADLRARPNLTADTIQEMSWTQLAMGNDVFISGVHRRSRMHYVSDLSDAVIAISARQAEQMAPLSFMSTHIYGGAMERVDEQATAMSHRSGTALRRWQDDYLDEIEPHATGAAYVNYLFDEPARVSSAYHPTSWKRLCAIKRAWDPENRFSANQNIAPVRE